MSETVKLRGKSYLYFETGCEYHRWNIEPEDEVKVSSRTGNFYVPRDGLYRVDNQEVVRIYDIGLFLDKGEILFEGCLNFQHGESRGPMLGDQYPNNYQSVSSLGRYPDPEDTDLTINDFLKIWYKGHPIEVLDTNV